MCYNLVCPETRKAIWVGQRDYIYSTPEHMKQLADWLHEHRDKPVFFVDDESSLIADIPEGSFVGLENNK